MFELVILSLLFLYFAVKWFVQRQNKLPPGPWGLPLVGYYPFIGKDPFAKIQHLSEKYGEIMRINLLNEDYYFFSSLETINEALIKKATNFIGRPFDKFNLTSLIYADQAILSMDGRLWDSMHPFFLGAFSQIGVGKYEFEQRIHGLCDKLVKNIFAFDGKPFYAYNYLKNHATNMITSILYSKHYDLNDAEYVELYEIGHLLIKGGIHLNGMLVGPLFHLLKIIDKKTLEDFAKAKTKFMKFFSRILQERLNSSDEEQYDDVFHYYLKEMNGPNRDTFTVETLLRTSVNLYIDGSDTTSITIYFGLIMMACRDDVQRKVHAEINDILGKDRMVSLRDRHLLNYTNAVIAEIQRFLCVVPFGVAHANHREDTIRGYRIPKRSNIVINIYRLSRDKRFFQNPENFDPQNFLDENGAFVSKEANIPFSTGKRRCIGAKLAEMEIYLTFITLMQKFEWKFANDKIAEVKIIDGLVRCCGEYEICAIPL